MEPNSQKNKSQENSEFIDEMGFQGNSSSNQDHFLSLRKNKRIKIQHKRINIETSTDKYFLNQNSYDQSNQIVQKFFSTQDKLAFLYDIISNLSNTVKSSNLDINLVKFVIVQSFNYYESQKDNIELLQKFFTETILSNLIEVMYTLKNNYLISYNISLLLIKLTFCSTRITKFITLNTNSLTQIFNCLSEENLDVNSNILSLLYNCYFEDEDNVNTKINIGLYVFGKLSNYGAELKSAMNQKIKIEENLRNLVSFLELLINDKTSKVYKKQFDINSRNNIIHLLIVLCQQVFEENLKIDSHNALVKLLNLAEPDDLDIEKFGVCNVSGVFLPHVKLETNPPEIVEKSMEILEKFSYLCDVEVLIDRDFLEQLDSILLCFNDMNNNVNPKPFYANYKKKNISSILNSLAITLNNAITFNDHKKFIINETNIVENLVGCLKIYDLENETIINIYGFFSEFVSNKDNCIKLILANFIDIGILDILNSYLSKKNYDVIKLALESCFLMLKESCSLTPGKPNVVKMYLEKKGFNEILNLIVGADFGNSDCSEIAKNIQDFFMNK